MLTIVTLNDFDVTHPKNSVINDLFDVKVGGLYEGRLNSFLLRDTSLIKNDWLALILTKAPDSGQEFKVKVTVKLSTNETYSAESQPIMLKP